VFGGMLRGIVRATEQPADRAGSGS
jgi:hypothetical protein